MSIPLVTSWQLQKISGEPSAIIRARNLQTTLQGPQDAWGRSNRPQPVLVSAEVSLAEPFRVSSSSDAVAGDTVHYGQLSKAILAVLVPTDSPAESRQPETLDSVMSSIWTYLTGLPHTGVCPGGTSTTARPFLTMDKIRRLTVSIVLPKASLLGSGVGLEASAVFEGSAMKARSLSLDVHELRVPTLIGVNDNERKAKQIVVANIGVERYTNETDGYVGLEAVVVDRMVDSSFETLEALASHLASDILGHLKSSGAYAADNSTGRHLRIELEKPTAVPLAEAACVELRTNAVTPLEQRG